MKVWLSLPFGPARDLRTLALAAADVGVDGVALSDHVCAPAAFGSPYPYNKKHQTDIPLETAFPDPLIAIASLAAYAPAVRFMTAILIVPLRNPVLLAKQVATTAAMTDGRLDLGVGVGWLREEFEALGLSNFDQRGAVTDEMLSLLQQLWTGEVVAHSGTHFRFDALASNPTPGGDVPLFIGGTSGVALRRCAEFGDGWVGANHSVDEIADILQRLRAARAVAATLDRPFEVRTGIKGAVTRARLQALRDLGVDALLLAPWQIGARRDSIYDLNVDEVIQALPGIVATIRET